MSLSTKTVSASAGSLLLASFIATKGISDPTTDIWSMTNERYSFIRDISPQGPYLLPDTLYTLHSATLLTHDGSALGCSLICTEVSHSGVISGIAVNGCFPPREVDNLSLSRLEESAFLALQAITALAKDIPDTPLNRVVNGVNSGSNTSRAVRSMQHEVNAVAEEVVHCYERNLKYTPKHDQWNAFPGDDAHGRGCFARQVGWYVQRGMSIRVVLPAFPCKSSNLNKVSGILPDKGEELALITLGKFADEVTKVYPPGIKLIVVSDGHVFADLVGTDDTVVDRYNNHLKLMAGAIFPPSAIKFYGLDDLLLTPINPDNHSRFDERGQKGFLGQAPLVTRKTDRAELGRGVLLDLFGERSALDDRLHSNPALLGLCRGFSRFVLEDTMTHLGLKDMKMSKRKAVAWETGKWMITRNEAYSKLVQVVFPSVIRLSIHPHDNAGPKFAISLLHPSLRGWHSVTSETFFHIPTPWHNVVLQLPYGGYALVKRKALHELAMTDHQVEWVVPVDPTKGAYYRLSISEGRSLCGGYV